MGTVLQLHGPEQYHVQTGQMRLRPQCVAGLHHRTSAVQRVRNVVADELCVCLLSNGAGHHVHLVVLDVSQEGRTVLLAYEFLLQNNQVPNIHNNSPPATISGIYV